MSYNYDDSGTKMPNHAIVLAAGLGRRMMPLTETTPKPLLPLGHHRIIDYTLDKFEEAGVTELVVNVHYKASQLIEHLEKRHLGHTGEHVRISQEAELLETGGGIKAALPWLGIGCFFVANADSVWMDGATPALDRLATLWSDDEMDALLLVVKTPPEEEGDYSIHPQTDKLKYRPGGDLKYAGLAIVHTRLFRDAPEGSFSLKKLFDDAERKGRLFGVKHNGKWFHLGTPEALAKADAEFRALNI
jgi:MurNAc alpha-1-phosphate uridylyltransferase